MMPGWEIALRVIGTIIVPVVGTILAYLLNNKFKPFSRLPKIARYAILGAIFGALSICGYYLGAHISYENYAGETKFVTFGTTAFAPFISGLLFDWPVVVIAGVIGALFRGLIDMNDILSLAIAIAISFSVVFSIFLNKIVFRHEKPRWYHAALGAAVVECFNNVLIFAISTKTAQESFQIVRYIDFAVIGAEVVSSVLIFVAIASINHTLHDKQARRKISSKIQRNIAILTAFGLVVLSGGSYALMANKSQNDAVNDLIATMEGIYYDLESITPPHGEEPTYFHNILVTSLGANRHIQSTGFVIVIALNDVYVYPDVGEKIQVTPGTVVSCKTGSMGKVIQTNDIYFRHPEKYMFSGNGHPIEYFDQYAAKYEDKKWNVPTFNIRFDNAIDDIGVEYLATYVKCGDDSCHGIMAVITTEEVNLNAGLSVRATMYAGTIIFVFLYIVIYILVDKMVVSKIHQVNDSLAKIMDGDVNEHIEIKDSIEFEELTTDINLAVGALKNYGEEINRRIEGDLELARSIQYNAVPLIFPYENEYEIYATMFTAKEVGGDFYDYLKLKGDRVMILIADVSGKGIPASLHMMRAKTLIKSLAHTISRPEDILETANNELCEQNKSGLFVTAWLGILNVKTGVLDYANAGHCMPLMRLNNTWSYVKGNKNFVLGGFGGLKYKPNQIKLEPSDMILLYTDGVTEATSKDKELYGEERLLKLVQGSGCTNPETLVDKVCEQVNAFQKGVDQFDDVTLLSLRYFGAEEAAKSNMGEITLKAQLGNIPTAVNFIKFTLSPYHLDRKIVSSLTLSANEILDNIAMHAYPYRNDNDTFQVKVKVDENQVTIDFIDQGLAFDPTKMKVDEKQGENNATLGIFIAEKNVDEMKYRHENNSNILTIVKKLKKPEVN